MTNESLQWMLDTKGESWRTAIGWQRLTQEPRPISANQ